MRKSRLQRTYAMAQDLFAQHNFTDAALMYEQILRTPLNSRIKKDINLRIRAACFAQLAGVKVALVDYKSNSKECIDNVAALFKNAILWLQQIQKPLKIDYLNYANTMIKLAQIHMGYDLLDDSIQSNFFNLKTVIRLSRQIKANYDKIKNHTNLRSVDILRIDLAELYYKIASYLFGKSTRTNKKTNVGEDLQKNKSKGLLNLDKAKMFMLAAIEVLNEVPDGKYDDKYWRLRLHTERLAVDIYSYICSDDDELKYYQLLIEHCKKIEHLTVDDLFFEDTIYTEYTDILKDTNEIICLNLTIINNLTAIKRFAMLFNDITDPKLIKSLYLFLANRFQALSETFLKIYGKNALEVNISKFAHLCYQNGSDDFNVSTIKYLNEELLFHCLNFNRNIASYVHALNIRLVIILIRRNDFPNKILKNFLSDEQNILLFHACMEPIILQQTKISHVERSDEGLEVAVPTEAEMNTEPVESSDDHRKRRAFTYKDDQITLMSARHVDKKGRTPSLSASSESNLDVKKKFNSS